MIRVVCEYCQTVYNIPEAKLTKSLSQATCKVCQNKIVIRRDDADTEGPAVRAPAATPTQASVERPGESTIAETELSNSWREAIVDNRSTNRMLKEIGVRVPEEKSTASGPKIVGAINVEPSLAPPINQADPARPLVRPVPPPSPLRTTPSGWTPDGISPIAAVSAGLACLLAAVLLTHAGAWRAGFSGLLGVGAVWFAAGAVLMAAALRKPGALHTLAALTVGVLLSGIATVTVLLTHPAALRELVGSNAALAPLVRYLPASGGNK